MQVNCCEPKRIFTFITSDFLNVFQYLDSLKSLVWKGPPEIIQLNFLLRSRPQIRLSRVLSSQQTLESFPTRGILVLL